MAGNRHWARQEIRALRAAWPDLEACARALPHRSLFAIQCKAYTLRLVEPRTWWSDAEIEALRQGWPVAGYRAVRHLVPGRSKTAVRSKAVKLGLVAGKNARKASFKPAGATQTKNMDDPSDGC